MTKLPVHMGIILDGNGRWATKRGLVRTLGHKAGIDAVKRSIDYALEFGVQYISFFAFSTENWKRDKDEVDAIFDLLRHWIKDNIDVDDKRIRYVVSGDLKKIPQDIAKDIETVVERSSNYSQLVVNLCINYGSRDEIVRAINLIVDSKRDKISFEDLKSHFFVPFLPDLDLVLRTSGEQRLSNFMLLQCAYAELYFPKVLWPAFRKKHFKKALQTYAKRDRRFGAIKKREKNK